MPPSPRNDPLTDALIHQWRLADSKLAVQGNSSTIGQVGAHVGAEFFGDSGNANRHINGKELSRHLSRMSIDMGARSTAGDAPTVRLHRPVGPSPSLRAAMPDDSSALPDTIGIVSTLPSSEVADQTFGNHERFHDFFVAAPAELPTVTSPILKLDSEVPQAEVARPQNGFGDRERSSDSWLLVEGVPDSDTNSIPPDLDPISAGTVGSKEAYVARVQNLPRDNLAEHTGVLPVVARSDVIHVVSQANADLDAWKTTADTEAISENHASIDGFHDNVAGNRPTPLIGQPEDTEVMPNYRIHGSTEFGAPVLSPPRRGHQEMINGELGELTEIGTSAPFHLCARHLPQMPSNVEGTPLECTLEENLENRELGLTKERVAGSNTHPPGGADSLVDNKRFDSFFAAGPQHFGVRASPDEHAASQIDPMFSVTTPSKDIRRAAVQSSFDDVVQHKGALRSVAEPAWIHDRSEARARPARINNIADASNTSFSLTSVKHLPMDEISEHDAGNQTGPIVAQPKDTGSGQGEDTSVPTELSDRDTGVVIVGELDDSANIGASSVSELLAAKAPATPYVDRDSGGSMPALEPSGLRLQQPRIRNTLNASGRASSSYEIGSYVAQKHNASSKADLQNRRELTPCVSGGSHDSISRISIPSAIVFRKTCGSHQMGNNFSGEHAGSHQLQLMESPPASIDGLALSDHIQLEPSRFHSSLAASAMDNATPAHTIGRQIAVETNERVQLVAGTRRGTGVDELPQQSKQTSRVLHTRGLMKPIATVEQTMHQSENSIGHCSWEAGTLYPSPIFSRPLNLIGQFEEMPRSTSLGKIAAHRVCGPALSTSHEEAWQNRFGTPFKDMFRAGPDDFLTGDSRSSSRAARHGTRLPGSWEHQGKHDCNAMQDENKSVVGVTVDEGSRSNCAHEASNAELGLNDTCSDLRNWIYQKKFPSKRFALNSTGVVREQGSQLSGQCTLLLIQNDRACGLPM